MKLTVKNNWESLEWSLDGERIDPNLIDSVEIDGWDWNVRAVERYATVNDMEQRYDITTTDIEIEAEVADVQIWVSLYKNPNVLKKIKGVSFNEYDTAGNQ